MTEYNKKWLPEEQSNFHSIKFDHLGPRQVKDCSGGTLKIYQKELKTYKEGESVFAFCRGCGYLGTIEGRKS